MIFARHHECFSLGGRRQSGSIYVYNYIFGCLAAMMPSVGAHRTGGMSTKRTKARTNSLHKGEDLKRSGDENCRRRICRHTYNKSIENASWIVSHSRVWICVDECCVPLVVLQQRRRKIPRLVRAR
jgi:hypothetical protein